MATEKEAFDRFISDGGIAYVPKHALDPMDALRLIGDAGGVCVLAHPAMWKGNGAVPDELIERWPPPAWAGSRSTTPTTTTRSARTTGRSPRGSSSCRPGASDCHGARYGYRLGCETTPVELVDELRRRAGA